MDANLLDPEYGVSADAAELVAAPAVVLPAAATVVQISLLSLAQCEEIRIPALGPTVK